MGWLIRHDPHRLSAESDKPHEDVLGEMFMHLQEKIMFPDIRVSDDDSDVSEVSKNEYNLGCAM